MWVQQQLFKMIWLKVFLLKFFFQVFNFNFHIYVYFLFDFQIKDQLIILYFY